MNLERITSLLAQGLKPAHVASIVGITPARISQLAKENVEFQNLLALKTAEAEKEDIEEKALSAKYHAAEHQLLDQVLQLAPVSELRDVTAALRVVAERQEKMKTRQNPIQQQQAVLQQVIQISLPSHVLQVPEITLTKDREVISVDNRNLAPLSSDAVTSLFHSLRKGKENESTRLPPTATEASSVSLQKEVNADEF
jgi:hypothetical protein